MRKSVFITGGSKGIGAACVELFSKNGFAVAFVYGKDNKAAQKLAAKTSALAIKADVSDVEQIEKAFDQARTYFGIRSFDVVVCNAGISASGLITDMNEDVVDLLIGINLVGTINVSRKAVSHMVEEKKGNIVMISSMWGQRAASCESIYAATKAGIIGFARSLAAELGPSGIRVNVVSPGVIATDMNREYSDEDMSALADETPLGRIGLPDEVAEAVYYLASDKASFINGQVLGVDGGFAV
ncbi:hypothetical protein HMPREF0380_00765 [Eubacterium infirmum F0142]|nr:hypothetical protein HMPREF0380_00765 [Eubacterium infirmum F0142]STO00978.1 3-oxoacyl-[acyl-carrier-protein] reductase FabG [[Eubacterium] infirmum]